MSTIDRIVSVVGLGYVGLPVAVAFGKIRKTIGFVIARAGGFTDLAYLKGARFTRENVRKLQQQRMDEALQKAQEDIIRVQTEVSQTASSAEEVASSKTALDNLMRSVEILKTKKAEGRVLLNSELGCL